MGCPYLDYRTSAGEQQFDVDRAYCTAAERFVQPMRADVCNDRYDLEHAAHCEIYREREDLDAADRNADDRESGDGPQDSAESADGGPNR